MKKDEILNASRKEHRNKDLAEMEVVYQAGSHASRVGALVCCLGIVAIVAIPPASSAMSRYRTYAFLSSPLSTTSMESR